MKKQEKEQHDKKIKEFENSKSVGIKKWFGFGKSEEQEEEDKRQLEEMKQNLEEEF